MGCEATSHTLAPVALLRAAAFPLERLTCLGDRDLARLCLQSDIGSAAPALVEAHAAAMERERGLLREVTTGDDAFMKALVIANPQLARAAAAPPGRRRKKAGSRSRRLHGALYRHLSRAVGRTEPADLWAGVALVRWGDETRVEDHPAKVLVHPDLRPFQAMLRSLATRSTYVWSETWRANATLCRQDDGRWLYTVRLADGRVVDRELQPNAAVDTVIPRLPGRSLTLGELADRLAGSLGVDDEVMRAQLEAYVGAGLLVGGLDLATQFATPWEALDRAGGRLRGTDSQAWHAAVRALRRCSHRLEAGLASMTPAQVAEVVDTAEGTVADLARHLRVPVEPSRATLRCDLGVGFHLTLGPDVRQRLEAVIAEREDPRCPATAGAGLRASLVARVREQVGDERPLAEAAQHFRSPRVGGVVAPGRSGEPEGSADRTVVRAPFGCLLTGLEEAIDRPSFRVRGVFDEVAPLYGRFAPLWSDSAQRPLDPLYPWLRRGLARLGDDCGLTVAALAGPCEANPNAVAAPVFVDTLVELWGTTESGAGLAGARLRTDTATGAPVVRMSGSGEDVVVFSFSSADLARDDRASELLLATSGRVAPAPSFEAAEVIPGDTDPAAGPETDHDAEPADAVARRTVLPEGVVEELRVATGVTLYVRWQRLAATHDWPETVRVRASAAAPPLLMRTTSPVAVEAVLGRLGHDIRQIVVEHADRSPWLVDRDGARYVSELAVPFSRATHLWSARTAVEDP